MERYIDKDALLERIRKLKMDIGNIFNDYDEGFWEGRITAFNDVICALDNLEVKDVDLEEEVNIWRHNHFHGRRDKDASGEYLERISQLALAKHFFELGLKHREESKL